ncbi:USP40 [Mytilus edulis]|uniref:USP40 n=1 Tax=Mytilus edulis TaxID=6550 RepID=A0A8S3R719_MYTED|nr:USP40 [Mytilus edulis]
MGQKVSGLTNKLVKSNFYKTNIEINSDLDHRNQDLISKLGLVSLKEIVSIKTQMSVGISQHSQKLLEDHLKPDDQFLEKHHDVFVLDSGCNQVSLGNSTKMKADKEENSPTTTAEPRNKRQEYEIEVNTITVQIHFSQSYEYYSGALHPRPDQCGWMELTIDRRKTIADLKIAVTEVNGTTVPSGQEYEPILLNISYGNDQLFIRGFSKSLTLEEFKVIVSEETRIKTKDLRLKRIVNQDTNPKLIDFSSDLLDTTLETLRLKNGDEIIAEDKSKLPVSDRTIQNKMKMTYPIYIENRGSSTVSEVKCMAVSKFCMSDINRWRSFTSRP